MHHLTGASLNVPEFCNFQAHFLQLDEADFNLRLALLELTTVYAYLEMFIPLRKVVPLFCGVRFPTCAWTLLSVGWDLPHSAAPVYLQILY
jgi:hypothetical protein